MSEIIYQHYIGKGPEAEAVIAEANEKYAAYIAAADAFKAEHGYENVWQRADWNGPRACGPVFKEKLDAKDARAKGLKLRTSVEEGYAYEPHLGTKQGKVLAEALAVLSKSAVDRVQYIVKALGMRHEVYFGARFAKTTAGFKDGILVVKVPTGNDDPQNGDMPTPPPWLVPCKESEALAALGQ